MKRILILITMLAVFASCKKSNEEIFDKKPEERLNISVNDAKTALLSAQNGWIATLPTYAGGGYGFYMSFDASENVKMLGDLNSAAISTVATSTYRLKAVMGTELIFDTFNYISLLVDPVPSVFGGAAGSGYKSDIEFLFTRSTTDTLVLTGKKYGQVMKLVKATAAQKTSYENGGYKTAIDKFKDFFTATKNPYIEITSGSNTLKVGMTFDFNNTLATGKRVNFSGLLADGKTIGTGSAKFGFTIDGAELVEAGLVYQGITFKRYAWKDATTLAIYDSTGKEYIIRSSATPLIPLHLALGVSYLTVSLPNVTTYPGWSADYASRRATAATAMLTGGYSLRLEQMTYTFNNTTKKLVLRVNMPQNTTQYVGVLNYNYTKTDEGVYKFNFSDADGNGSIIVPFMASLLAQRLNVDTFTVDYMVHPTTGALLAIFTSVQNPTFTFTGTI